MPEPTATLPRWDMSVVYPSLDSPEFEAGLASVVAGIDGLAELFDQNGVERRDPSPLDAATVAAVDEVIERMNAVIEAAANLGSYISAFISTDSRNDRAQAIMSGYQQQGARLQKLETRFTAWVGSLDVDGLIERSELAAAHAFALQQAKRRAAHLMSPAEEDLAAELNLSAGSAWAKLYNNLTSQIGVPFEQDGAGVELPMSAIRNLAHERDRETRRRAYEAELAAWQQHALPLASAINGIKGQVNTLATRRGWPSPLDEACFNNHIDRATLDAMLTAARESFPDFRRYLRAKARALGLDSLTWYDLFAPLGESPRVWTWDEARAFIVRHFHSYSQRMGEFAERAFNENWIDAEPRPGKRDGAFCMPLRADESRILANFKPSFSGVTTLAHELGHGYHNINRCKVTILQRTTPMALAETASIFCETIIRDAGLQEADEAEALAILEGSLQGNCQVVVDITSRFLFEQAVFEQRANRELAIDELNEIMLDAQRQTYGDGLDMDVLHPYMWAVKGHYYSAGRSFYNFPYMFGQLFALGLYAQYQRDPETFRASYDDLLMSTGLDDAATLANRFGIDIQTPAFWRASLDIIRADINRFEEIVGK
ncbi:MAG TPA: M3 family oligoendopeptidase [Thermomicrobiales bacterium]|nr:M3 family oligoendopeptidase [Thermomicrobiales bacterium]